jgi:hypothetical protein
VPPGLSIPTSLTASLLPAPSSPEHSLLQPLAWLASNHDAPLLTLLGLVLLYCGLGLWCRKPSQTRPTT